MSESCCEQTDGATAPQRASGASRPAGDLDFAPLIPRPEKIICVGLNYRNHILETGRDVPEYPTLFAKFIPALIGANDDVILPLVSDACRLGGRARGHHRQAGAACTRRQGR